MVSSQRNLPEIEQLLKFIRPKRCVCSPKTHRLGRSSAGHVTGGLGVSMSWCGLGPISCVNSAKQPRISSRKINESLPFSYSKIIFKYRWRASVVATYRRALPPCPTAFRVGREEGKMFFYRGTNLVLTVLGVWSLGSSV